jgi:hypothetical protein
MWCDFDSYFLGADNHYFGSESCILSYLPTNNSETDLVTVSNANSRPGCNTASISDSETKFNILTKIKSNSDAGTKFVLDPKSKFIMETKSYYDTNTRLRVESYVILNKSGKGAPRSRASLFGAIFGSLDGFAVIAGILAFFVRRKKADGDNERRR